MGLFSRKPKTITKNIGAKASFSLFGDWNTQFSTFGNDAYKSAVVRSCIRPLADHTSKLNVGVYRDIDGEIRRANIS